MPETRLLYVINDAAFFLSHRLSLAQAARAAGYEVHIATPRDEHVERITGDDFPHHPIGLTRKGRGPLGELRAFWDILQLLRRLRPDIVHLVTIKPVIYGGIAARISGTPRVVAAITGLGHAFLGNDVLSRLLRPVLMVLYRLALGHARMRVIFQNRDDRELFSSSGLVDSGRVALIPGAGIDMQRFVDTPEPEGKLIVLYAGRMLWTKGVAEFVAAAKILKGRGVDARFVLTGGPDIGNAASIPERQIETWVAENAVEWWGVREDMPQVFAQSHIICLPSHGEGLPKVLAEAAACGRALVASDVPGCREVVRHGGNGLLVTPRDSAVLADAIAILLGDATLRKRMGERGRALAESRFGSERVNAATLAVYEALLGDGMAARNMAY